MKIWIAGAAGQLGCALNDMAKEHRPDAELDELEYGHR